MKTNACLRPPWTAGLSSQDKLAPSFHEKLPCQPKGETWEQTIPLDSTVWSMEGPGFQSQVQKVRQEGQPRATCSVDLGGNRTNGTFMVYFEISTGESGSNGEQAGHQTGAIKVEFHGGTTYKARAEYRGVIGWYPGSQT